MPQQVTTLLNVAVVATVCIFDFASMCYKKLLTLTIGSPIGQLPAPENVFINESVNSQLLNGNLLTLH